MVLFAIGIELPDDLRFKAFMTPIRANIVGPPDVAMSYPLPFPAL
jgi:hypothetical protein